MLRTEGAEMRIEGKNVSISKRSIIAKLVAST